MATTRSHRTMRPPAGARPGIRLTRRGRITLVLLIVAAMLGAFWLGTWRAGVAATAGSGERWPAAPRDAVLVRPGQTLWEVAVKREPDADPRKVVHRIVELNDLASVSVEAGQRIIVPAGG